MHNISNAQTTEWRVIWDANPNSEKVDYYTIYKGINESFSSMDSIGTVNHDTTISTVEFVDSQGLIPGQMYYYRVIAVNDSGVSSNPSDAAFEAIPKINLNFSEFILNISDTLSFNLNQTDYVSDENEDINLLVWNVYDPVDNDSIYHSQPPDSFSVQFITPNDSTIKDTLIFTVFDTSRFYDEKSISINLIGQSGGTSVWDTSIINIDFPDTIIEKGENIPSLDLDKFVNSSIHDTNEIDWTWAYESGEVLLSVLISSDNVANISILPTSDSTGTETIKFQATKPDSSYDFGFMTISINEPGNHGPHFKSSPVTSIMEDSLYTYTVTANDSDGDALIFELINNSPSLLSIVALNDTSALISGIPRINDVGQHQVTIRVIDGNGGEDNQVYLLTVIPNNRRPYFTSDSVTTSILGELYFYEAISYDPDGDNLTFWLSGDSPSFLDTSITDTSIKLLGTPVLSDLGEHAVSIFVSDGIAGTDTQEFVIVVRISPLESVDNEIKVFPIPWIESQSQFQRIIFDNIPLGSILLLYNLLGEAVLNVKVNSDPYLWKVKNNSGLDVQSGLYFYYIKTDGKIVDKGKIVIVR